MAMNVSANDTELASTDAVEELGPPRQKNRMWLIRLVSIIVTLLVWEWFGRQIEPLFMSYPTAIATAAVEMVRSGEIIDALEESLLTLVLGFSLASVLGIVFGLLIGRYRAVEAAT